MEKLKKITAQLILWSHVTCQEHNPGKTVRVGHDQKPRPQGPLDYPQIDFIQLPASVGSNTF